MKRFLMYALFGIAALFLINVTGEYTGAYLPITQVSLIGSVALGIPGVIVMLLLQMVL